MVCARLQADIQAGAEESASELSTEFFESILWIAEAVVDRSIATASRAGPMAGLVTPHGVVRLGGMKLFKCRQLDVVSGNGIGCPVSAMFHDAGTREKTSSACAMHSEREIC